MSSLWTPGGEHPVDRNQPGAPSTPPSEAQAPQPPPQGAGAPPSGADDFVMPDTIPGPDGEPINIADLSPEERAQVEAYAREMAAARQQLLETPASVVVANHAMGLYELAAIHLSQNPPNFAEASVAIDGLAGILSNLEGRLGENEPILAEARGQLQQAFVQLKTEVDGSTE